MGAGEPEGAADEAAELASDGAPLAEGAGTSGAAVDAAPAPALGVTLAEGRAEAAGTSSSPPSALSRSTCPSATQWKPRR